MNLKFYTTVTKGLKLIVRKLWGLVPTFAEFTEEKLLGGGFLPPPPLSRSSILNRINCSCSFALFGVDKVTSVALSFTTSVVAITQFLDQFRSSVNSQLIKGILKVLQKLLRYFNSTIILTF